MLQRLLGIPLAEFTQLSPTRRAELARDAVPDLHGFLTHDATGGEDEPERTRRLAEGLGGALRAVRDYDPAREREIAGRIVTNGLLRAECAHDQNVYLGPLFTRRMTRAVPDVVFQPLDGGEAAVALHWARKSGLPVTLRGAATTAMGGAVPAAAGLVLDTSRLDSIEIDDAGRRVALGAGVRMRPLHARLASRGLALPVYPSNLGGTFAGWLCTGGIGMNAYGRGRALDVVAAAELVLPGGEQIRLARDGELELIEAGGERTYMGAAGAWLRSKGYVPFGLADLAGSEGQLGLLVGLELDTQPLPDLAVFLLAFATRDDALTAVEWVGREVERGLEAPANVKLLSGSHMQHARAVWAQDDRLDWRSRPGAYSGESGLPWRRIAGPEELGVESSEEQGEPQAYLFVDFLSVEAGRDFARRLAKCPGAPTASQTDSVRVARDRFRPQQVKRLGPGFLAAEILMPARQVIGFLPAAERLARGAGVELDAEVYYLADGSALPIAGYVADHRRGSFQLALLVVPALLDLAERRFEGRPYVLGRWQAAHVDLKFDADSLARLRELKRSLDPDRIVNRGSFFDMGLSGLLGWLLARTMRPSGRLFRQLFRMRLLTAALRWTMDRFDGPAAGHGFTAAEHSPAATGRAIACVNCGECNSVCPIFNESSVRLPQMLTHAAERLHAQGPVGHTTSALLDLCMRCGNCEQVCQAGIPHLPMYRAMQATSDGERPPDRERHVLLLERLRASARYTGDFLDVRPGGYIERAPAALPGEARFLLLRAEDEAGPNGTCIHCGACVDVCPTAANKEFEGYDPRWITTDQTRCIGCGTCVEVCPANLENGGRTLRVMEAPTNDLLAALREFAAEERT